ncbi:MAG: HU family DNA-binding protein [Thermoanaerobaculia bacterium]|nr:HU family DNA-binding protein [Thermoanaerobaculia bacterium]
MAGKADCIAYLADHVDISKRQAGDAFDALIDCITDTLKSGDRVQIAGFGTFSVVERAAREGRNPRTGETIPIPASKSVKFRVGAALKDAVNG